MTLCDDRQNRNREHVTGRLTASACLLQTWSLEWAERQAGHGPGAVLLLAEEEMMPPAIL